MRGKAKRYLRFLLPTGITPAYAGKSRCSRLRCGVFRDHPRVCGEKKKMNMRKDKRMGSPPRMRGKATTSSLPFPISGITPAYAGKSRTLLRCVLLRWDHPRVCGEKCMSRCLHRLGARITPAYAGKRSAWPSVLRRQRDHPRVCGEKSSHTGELSLPLGSPPRMRGKDAFVFKMVLRYGITPAYAGKSLHSFPFCLLL